MAFRAPTRRAFNELVSRALDSLPQDMGEHMSNLEIVVEDDPDPSLEEDECLLGLYQGVPLTERGGDYFGVLPDRIVLFRNNIEDASETAEDLEAIVRTTVIHEVAHHFGIDDERLEELGWA